VYSLNVHTFTHNSLQPTQLLQHIRPIPPAWRAITVSDRLTALTTSFKALIVDYCIITNFLTNKWLFYSFINLLLFQVHIVVAFQCLVFLHIL